MIAALAVAPSTAPLFALAPAAVMTRTKPIATITVLWPERKGTQRIDTTAEAAAPATAARAPCHRSSSDGAADRRRRREAPDIRALEKRSTADEYTKRGSLPSCRRSWEPSGYEWCRSLGEK